MTLHSPSTSQRRLPRPCNRVFSQPPPVSIPCPMVPLRVFLRAKCAPPARDWHRTRAHCDQVFAEWGVRSNLRQCVARGPLISGLIPTGGPHRAVPVVQQGRGRGFGWRKFRRENCGTPEFWCTVAGTTALGIQSGCTKKLLANTLGTQDLSVRYTGYTRKKFWDTHSHKD